MLSLLAPLILAKAAKAVEPPPGLPVDYPAALQAPLTDARRFTGFLENCGMRKAPPAVRRQFDQLSDRLGSDIARDRGIWGFGVKGHDLRPDGVELFWSDKAPTAFAACSAKALTQAAAKAKDAIAAYEAAFAATTAGMAQGLWIGPLKACKAGVTASQTGRESGGGTWLSITFDKRSAAALKAISVNSLKLPLDVRLDGKLIMQPFLTEPLNSGGLRISSDNAAQMARAKEASSGPC